MTIYENIEKNNDCRVKGLVLAGGKGERLTPLTNYTSKQLLSVGDKALILYPIKTLLKAGVKDIFILIDHRHASQYMELLKDGSHFGARSLVYVWQSEKGKGLPSAIAQIEPLIKDEKIVVICGDMIIKDGIDEAVADFVKQKNRSKTLCDKSK